MVHDVLDLVIARVLPETLVVKVSFVEFDRAAVVAEHKLLERHEAHIPRVTLFIGNESRKLSGLLDHRTDFKLPHAAINVCETHEWSPVFEYFRLCRGHRHLADIGNQVLIVEVVEKEL